MQLILASKSSRRKELLQSLNMLFSVVSADIDESHLPEESPEEYVARLAHEKARIVASQFTNTSCVILAADTVVVQNGTIFGKPKDAEDAKRMLRALSGKQHHVLTGYAAVRLPENRVICGVEASIVLFKELPEWEIEAYAATGEPLDKAGAYAIQGKARTFVQLLKGSYSNVVGLPLETVGDILKDLGLFNAPSTPDRPD